MNWVLAIIAAIFGAALAENENLYGALGAFFLVMIGFALQRQSREVAALRRELASLRARQARPEATPTAAAAPGHSPAPPAGSVPPPVPERRPVAEPAMEPARAAQAPTPPPPPPPPRAPAPPPAPDWFEQAASRIKHWFTEGNVPVKVGVLVLLFGVAAALRLAVANGYLSVSIEARLALIAAAALAGLALGWRERQRRPAFAMSLQGGALGVLLLTVFAAYRLYGLLPPTMAFALVVVLVAGSALLAVLQEAMWLAVLGFLGGYLAPVLISTGSADHVALFSYYAILNAAVFAISWRRAWRLLNLIGFVFTFGVGSMWGARYYQPALFATVEPFLVLFFAFYLVIGLLYVLRQTSHRRPWVDGTLVFGTPLVSFPLQAGMLSDQPMALALSALFVSLVYVGLLAWLRRRPGERLLTEAYGALALGFATLAIPLAFSADTTAGLWALEGVGAAWLGLRQKRWFPWLGGLALQLLAAGAYVTALQPGAAHPAAGWLMFDAQWLGAAILAFSGLALSLIHDRHAPRFGLPPLLFAWGVLWWAIAGASQVDDAALTALGSWRYAALYLGASALLATLFARVLSWPRLELFIPIVAVAGWPLAAWAQDSYGQPLAWPALAAWAAFAAGVLVGLRAASGKRPMAIAAAHLAWLWTLALVLVLQAQWLARTQALADGWHYLALVAPVAAMSLLLWRRPAWLAWPRVQDFAAYQAGWFVPAGLLLAGAFVVGLFLEGDARPLAYLPLLNPLELMLLATGVLLFARMGADPQLRRVVPSWPVPALAFVSMATLRAVHHLHGEPWSLAIFDSGFSQASLTVVWSLIGVAAWVAGSRRRSRPVWGAGAVLMGVVLLKLLVVDRGYMGNLPGIVSFLAVGLLLVGVGYLAPSPPRSENAGAAA